MNDFDLSERRLAEAAQIRAYVSRAGDAFRWEAELIQLSPKGATCGLEPGGLTCPLGEPLLLWLVHGASGVNHPIPARLVRRSDDASRVHVGLEFTDPEVLATVLHPSLAHAFNRRAAIRVPVEGPVILIPPRDASVALETAELRDLSVGGFAAEVPAAFEQAMVGRAELESLFRLPGDPTQHSVAVTIRHRSLVAGGRVRYGVMFAESADGRLESVRAAVTTWIASQAQSGRLG